MAPRSRKGAAKRRVSELDNDEEDEDQVLSDESDFEEERPKKKPKAASKLKTEACESRTEAEAEAKAEAKAQEDCRQEIGSSDESSLSDIDSEDVKDAGGDKPVAAEEQDASSGEESIVIDEPPKRKRQSQEVLRKQLLDPKQPSQHLKLHLTKLSSRGCRVSWSSAASGKSGHLSSSSTAMTQRASCGISRVF